MDELAELKLNGLSRAVWFALLLPTLLLPALIFTFRYGAIGCNYSYYYFVYLLNLVPTLIDTCVHGCCGSFG
jgi:hypothetical protein